MVVIVPWGYVGQGRPVCSVPLCQPLARSFLMWDLNAAYVAREANSVILNKQVLLRCVARWCSTHALPRIPRSILSLFLFRLFSISFKK